MNCFKCLFFHVLLLFVLLDFEYVLGTNQDCTQPLVPSRDTLCGYTNTTVLECHAERVRCDRSRNGHWSSVCLFLPSGNPIIRNHFISNHDDYNCFVLGSFGLVNCTSHFNPLLTFNAVCNFTFYYCDITPVASPEICLDRFSLELEKGGSCPPPVKECPSENLFSLTHSFICNNETIGEASQIRYTDLQKLFIRPPRRCTVDPTLKYAILFASLFMLFLLIIVAVLYHKYKKLDKRIQASLEKDPVVRMTEKVFSEWDEFQKKEQKFQRKEIIDPWYPNQTTPNWDASSKEKINRKKKISDSSQYDKKNQTDVAFQEDLTEKKSYNSVNNPTYFKSIVNELNDDECNSNKQDTFDGNVVIVKSYTLKSPSHHQENVTWNSGSSQISEQSSGVFPHYLKENQYPAAIPNGYLHKNEHFCEDSSDKENSSLFTTDSSSLPSYLRKHDLGEL